MSVDQAARAAGRKFWKSQSGAGAAWSGYDPAAERQRTRHRYQNDTDFFGAFGIWSDKEGSDLYLVRDARRLLASHSGETMQGYLFDCPICLSNFIDLLRTQASATALRA